MNAEKLSIILPADMARMIRRQVDSGAYSSNSEFIREVMWLWKDRRTEREQRLDVIRAKIQEAVDDPRRITDEELGRHFDARLAEAEKNQKRMGWAEAARQVAEVGDDALVWPE